MATNRRQRRTTSSTPRDSRRATSAAPAETTDAPEQSASAVDWKEEYAYVYRDLRHLGVISVTIFALLLIIGYFI